MLHNVKRKLHEQWQLLQRCDERSAHLVEVGNTAIAYLAGTITQGLAILNNPDYAPKAWEGTLIIWAVLTFLIVFNTFFASKLPLLEGTVLVLHMLDFFAILVQLWVLGDQPKPAVEVFITFSDGGQWGNQGLSCRVGMLSPVFSFIGPDSATHMSEELCDASRTLPLAMIWTAAINGAMGFVMNCTLVIVIGDLDAALNSPTGYAFIQVFHNATQSNAGTPAMTAILIIMLLFGFSCRILRRRRQKGLRWARCVRFEGYSGCTGSVLCHIDCRVALLECQYVIPRTGSSG